MAELENGELTLLAQDYDEEKHNPNGWFCSEKLDGQRAIWLPGTRRLPVERVPFANRERDARDHVATGLWSRYGKVIHAPTWFLDQLPPFNLDGELWIGRGQNQSLSSCVRKLIPVDHEWKNVRLYVFDSPACDEFWKARRIYTTHYKFVFDGKTRLATTTGNYGSFDKLLLDLRERFADNDAVVLHEQSQLSFGTRECLDAISEKLTRVVGAGGEGLILRHYNLTWHPKRTYELLKVKPVQYGTAVIVGWAPGKGKLKGMMGALKMAWQGKLFELSGFTNNERTLVNGEPFYFPAGKEIAFKYRELTDAGIPKEARYNRP